MIWEILQDHIHAFVDLISRPRDCMVLSRSICQRVANESHGNEMQCLSGQQKHGKYGLEEFPRSYINN